MNIIRFSIIAVIIVGISLFSACNKEKTKPENKATSEAKSDAAVVTVLATITEDEKPQPTAPVIGHKMAPASMQVAFSQNGGGVAYVAARGSESYVVHNGRVGKRYAAIGELAISPDGSRSAYTAMIDGRWHLVIDGKEGVSFNAIKAPTFSPDGRHVAYQAMQGEMWFMAVDHKTNEGTETSYAEFAFNVDSTMIAYVVNADDNKAGRLVISDLEFKEQTTRDGAGSPMVTNADRTRIAAVSAENDKVRVIESSFGTPAATRKGPLCDRIDKLGFGPDGVSLAYSAKKSGKNVLIFNERMEKIPDGFLVEQPAIRPDLKAVGIILAKNNPGDKHSAPDAPNTMRMHQLFVAKDQQGKTYDDAGFLVYSGDGSRYAYTARLGKKWFVVVNGSEGPAYDRTVQPVFSPDGRTLIYRARQEGKRFVVVADSDGKTLKQLPAYEQVFQPIFAADGKSIAYGAKDGAKLIWRRDRL